MKVTIEVIANPRGGFDDNFTSRFPYSPTKFEFGTEVRKFWSKTLKLSPNVATHQHASSAHRMNRVKLVVLTLIAFAAFQACEASADCGY